MTCRPGRSGRNGQLFRIGQPFEIGRKIIREHVSSVPERPSVNNLRRQLRIARIVPFIPRNCKIVVGQWTAILR